ncbi:MAG TPA: hypothetical protein VKR52_19085 [Terracidiphilus sp.]|nr:hypothetical protein [Terracidiphilus sp.]
MKTLAVAALLGTGLMLAGCKSAPELTQQQALALIQAKYDQTPAAGANILVSDLGMRQGITAKYWQRTTIYPNHFWADFKLTPDGKKVVQLPGGGDTIQWRPDSASDTNYTVRVMTVQANHLKARGLGQIQDEVVPGVDTAKGAQFVESVDMTGVPGPLQDIAHNPGNSLSSKKQADFALVNGAWTLHSIE